MFPEKDREIKKGRGGNPKTRRQEDKCVGSSAGLYVTISTLLGSGQSFTSPDS